MSSLSLRDWLANQGFEAEERLPPERELAEALGISRSNLRQSLADLEREGFILRQVGRGTFLRRNLGASEAMNCMTGSATASFGPKDFWEARIELDGILAAAAARAAGSRELKALRDAMAAFEHATPNQHRLSLDRDFHRSIAEATRNPLLVQLSETLWSARLDGQPIGPLREPEASGDFDASCSEHRECVEMIESRDIQASVQVARKHVAREGRGALVLLV